MSGNSEFGVLGDAPHARRRVVFDPTVNLGHIITFVGFMLAGFSAYSTLDKRITITESQFTITQERNRESEQRTKDSLGELKGDVKDLQRSVNDLSRVILVAPPRPARQDSAP